MVAIIGSLIHVDIRYLQEIGTCRQKFILGLIVRHAAEAFQVIVTTDDKGILRGSVSGQVRRLVVRIENLPYLSISLSGIPAHIHSKWYRPRPLLRQE